MSIFCTLHCLLKSDSSYCLLKLCLVALVRRILPSLFEFYTSLQKLVLFKRALKHSTVLAFNHKFFHLSHLPKKFLPLFLGFFSLLQSRSSAHSSPSRFTACELMALVVSSRGRISNKYSADRQTSPERTKVWTEPNSKIKVRNNGETRYSFVPVVYYLSRNGQLDHPHFMEVPLSSSQGLFLKDVINRLDFLRGKGMANRYAWSAKRNYKNGYVWHDLEENDFICPIHGHEYVLKGSEILIQPSPCSKSSETASSEVMVVRSRRRNEAVKEEQIDEDEISPPPSDSSVETLESLMKSDGGLALTTSSIQTVDQDSNPTATEELVSGGKMKPSSILMSLISCGSVSFRDALKGQGLSLISPRLPRGGNPTVEKLALEEKEYFSGSLSLIENNADHHR